MLVAVTLALVVHHRYPDQLTPGQVGLAIGYTLMTPIYLQWVVRFWSELEMYFNAVERVMRYSHLRPESELPIGVDDHQETVTVCPVRPVTADWPTKGEIEMSDVSISYHHSLEPVVRNLTLTIKHGQRVGICGRTASGKSTVVNAIFRLADIVSGTIRLDGVDITTVEPHVLRSKLAIVPQDSLIIAGTLR